MDMNDVYEDDINPEEDEEREYEKYEEQEGYEDSNDEEREIQFDEDVIEGEEDIGLYGEQLDE